MEYYPIKDFPVPKDITSAPSWFGLVNQISTIMQPTQDLVKRKNKFCCNTTLDKLFSDLKSLLIYKVQEGIKTFGINKCTCLQTNWSKDGIGYLPLQQNCSSPPTNASMCCPDGWHLIFTGPQYSLPIKFCKLIR